MWIQVYCSVINVDEVYCRGGGRSQRGLTGREKIKEINVRVYIYGERSYLYGSHWSSDSPARTESQLIVGDGNMGIAIVLSNITEGDIGDG